MDSNGVKEKCVEIINTFIEHLNIEGEAEIEVSEIDGGFLVNIDFKGEALGYLIGNAGKNLQALQTITNLIINKELNHEQKAMINIDVDGYKKERFSRIEEMVRERAEDARMLGEKVNLQPMGAAERRVVHTVIAEYDDLKSESAGEGRDRYVQIIPVNSETELN